MGVSTDIDIDFPSREKALAKLWHVPAAMVNSKGERTKHKTGVYFQDIPIDPVDGLAVYDFNEAADRGYFKIDFLPNYIYDGVRDETHMIDLLVKEPDWSLFEKREVVEKLAQLSDHYDSVQVIKPRSIEDLAICIAVIRPGKKHLLNCGMDEIRSEIWKPVAGYSYKKSHAIAYAASIVVQLNLMCEKANPRPGISAKTPALAL